MWELPQYVHLLANHFRQHKGNALPHSPPTEDADRDAGSAQQLKRRGGENTKTQREAVTGD